MQELILFITLFVVAFTANFRWKCIQPRWPIAFFVSLALVSLHLQLWPAIHALTHIGFAQFAGHLPTVVVIGIFSSAISFVFDHSEGVRTSFRNRVTPKRAVS